MNDIIVMRNFLLDFLTFYIYTILEARKLINIYCITDLQRCFFYFTFAKLLLVKIYYVISFYNFSHYFLSLSF